jgi:hypothetical protein
VNLLALVKIILFTIISILILFLFDTVPHRLCANALYQTILAGFSLPSPPPIHILLIFWDYFNQKICILIKPEEARVES